jgi:hypothetical protein
VLQYVLAQEDLAIFDVPVVNYFATHRVDWLTSGMQGVTYLGSGRFLLAVVIAVGLFLRYRTGSWRASLLLACVAIGAMTLDVVVKFAIARSRPPAEWMIVPACGGRLCHAHEIGCLPRWHSGLCGSRYQHGLCGFAEAMSDDVYRAPLEFG